MRLSDLNYQHLRYFHVVAHEGSVQRASRLLHLAPSTVSGQIKVLEGALGRPLFERVGRALALTTFGREVLAHADRIFDEGEALVRAIARGDERRPFRVGVSSVIPKLLAREILQPALGRADLELRVEHGAADELVGRLVARRLDVVLSDHDLPPWLGVRATSHVVVETAIAVFGTPELVDAVLPGLPESLADVPWLVPPAGTSLRLGLEAWWDAEGITPTLGGVVDDSGLLKALGEAGVGLFAAPATMTPAILDGYRVRCVGQTDRVQERTWAITRDASPEDPVLRAVCRLDGEVAEAGRGAPPA